MPSSEKQEDALNLSVIQDLNNQLNQLKQEPVEDVLVSFKGRVLDAIEVFAISETDVRLHSIDIETGEFITVTTPEDTSVEDLFTALDWSIEWVLETYRLGILHKDIFPFVKKTKSMVASQME